MHLLLSDRPLSLTQGKNYVLVIQLVWLLAVPTFALLTREQSSHLEGNFKVLL